MNVKFVYFSQTYSFQINKRNQNFACEIWLLFNILLYFFILVMQNKNHILF